MEEIVNEKVLSIIIPVWNKSHFTKTCLQDLAKLTNDHEIVVVDNGSIDDTNTMIVQLATELPCP